MKIKLLQLKFTLELESDSKLTPNQVSPESGVSPDAAMKHKTDAKQNIRKNVLRFIVGGFVFSSDL